MGKDKKKKPLFNVLLKKISVFKPVLRARCASSSKKVGYSDTTSSASIKLTFGTIGKFVIFIF
jgi:hypothetical protein